MCRLIGAGLISYIGHAGVDRLAAEGLLTSADVGGLSNSNRTPVVTSLSCIMGRFAIPGFDCLGETLLLKGGGGSAAVWSPSGMSVDSHAAILGEKLYGEMFGGSEKTLGDAVVKAMRAYRDGGSTKYLLSVYNLLGDPALRLGGEGAAVSAYDPACGGPLLKTFGSWQYGLFAGNDLLNAALSGPDADPDGDGMSNAAEYALGGNPWRTEQEGGLRLLDVIGNSAGPYDAVVTFRRRKAAQDVACVLEVSPDLFTWLDSEAWIAGTEFTDDGNGVTETVKVYVRSPSPSRRVGFVRLLVIRR